ncbi:TetR/AcrR family transcriptional regulator [Novosphingobium sp. AP12]|uniref:TetR/AcrR family transcriptional regulator n=1 Tax=Novosphingobium sp. AP12 TaxID=1144305 RepID=UPI0002721960|nr:TetR/AcrR family transcriptional regulator [Novosphingobium sp. AP12]EJL35050.1 transcriptional regulator [Novosphingobium sp. AP12]
MDVKKEPKRRDPVKTRARILAAAYDRFARHGFANTGIRDIAREADVASSLILRYFDTKANLFHDALVYGIFNESLFTREKARFGERMAKMICETSEARLTSLMVMALADPESREVASRVLLRQVIEPLAEWLGPPNAQARAMNLYGLMSGFVIQVRMLDDRHIAPASVKWLAKAMQDIVDEA